MSLSDKSLLKDTYFYKLKCINRWFINIIIVHIIFSVITFSFGGSYFSGGSMKIAIQQIVSYGELIFASVCVMFTTGYCLAETDFRRMAYSVPITRKIDSISNFALMGTIATFTTVSTLMIENVKMLFAYYSDSRGTFDNVYMISNIYYKVIFDTGVKILVGLVLAGLIGYVYSLLRRYHKRGLYIGMVTLIVGLIILGYLGVEFAIFNVIVDAFTSVNSLIFLILSICISIILVFSAYKIVDKGDVC